MRPYSSVSVVIAAWPRGGSMAEEWTIQLGLGSIVLHSFVPRLLALALSK